MNKVCTIGACIVLMLNACQKDNENVPEERVGDSSFEQISSEYEGTWTLDEETVDWLPRSCIDHAFDENSEPGFDILSQNDLLIVQFRNGYKTTWIGDIKNRRFTASQILRTSTSGRFCGSETRVRIQLKFTESESDSLTGIWQTPQCSVCPDRHFGAVRTVHLNSSN